MEERNRKLAIGGLALAVVGGGLLLAWYGSGSATPKRASRASSAPRPRMSSAAVAYSMNPVSGSVPGVTISPGISLSARQWKFIRNFRALVPLNVPITVTSGLRTVERQAEIMWDFYTTNGAEKFKGLYNVAAERLLRLPYSQWLPEIRSMYAEGILHADEHTGGGAIDVHISTLPPASRDALISAAQRLGANPLVEDPPLLHISDLPM